VSLYLSIQKEWGYLHFTILEAAQMISLVSQLGLGQLCLMYYAKPAIPENMISMTCRNLYYAQIMLNYVMCLTFDPRALSFLIN